MMRKKEKYQLRGNNLIYLQILRAKIIRNV